MNHHEPHEVSRQRSRKRKATGEVFLLNELNEDLLERVLAWLPASSFFRLRSVCKRWSSVATSATFQRACSLIPFRDPWLYMVEQDADSQPVVFDTSENSWKTIDRPRRFEQAEYCKLIPVASCGGLICYRTDSGSFAVCNPITGACRELPLPGLSDRTEPLHAIAMHASSTDGCSYKIVLIFGGLSNLCFKMYDSKNNSWGNEAHLHRKSGNSVELDMAGDAGYSVELDMAGHESMYFLSKSGDCVATSMQRSASKQYSAVLIMEDGEEVVYFLSDTGTVIACNLDRKTSMEYPRLLPIYSEYSIDMIQCQGELMLVLLSEFLETTGLGVWKFSKSDRSWYQVAAMPPSMSHDYHGKQADVNCLGCRDSIFICLTSNQLSSCLMYDFWSSQWAELPKYYVDGRAKQVVSAFSFEPRLEASA